MRVDEALVDELRRQGVRQVFGLLGEDIARLVVALPPAGIDYLSSRHESGAVGMADGYARVSGDVGVAVISRGPGLVNALTAITTASRCGSRVLVVVADTSARIPRSPSVVTTARSSHKFVEQTALLAAVGVRHVAVHEPSAAVSDLAAAIEQVRLGSTVVVDVPVDVLHATYDESAQETTQRGAHAGVAIAGAPAAREIGAVVDLLEATWAVSLPVILAGRGAVRANAAGTLTELGTMMGALFATTLPAVSMFHGNPFNVGIMGTFSSAVAAEQLGRCDLVLSFGASLNLHTTYANSLCPKARVVQFDSDPDAFGRFVDPVLTVQGDVGRAADALLAELKRRGHTNVGYRTSHTARSIANFDPMIGLRDQSDDEGVDPRFLVAALNDVVRRDRVLVVDAGHHMAFQIQHFELGGPQSAVMPIDFGAIGSALPMAIGAAIARPDRLVVLGAGDGGVMMTLGELDTAVRAKVPLLLIVFNDSAYGAEVHLLDSEGLPATLARFDERSFADIAASLDVESMSIRSLEDVTRLEERLQLGLDSPLLVDCRITTAVRADFVESMMVASQASEH